MNDKTTMAYRPDIDGLRAIAILAVVAYHAGLPLAKGGFVGVDIFFVISGYLITGLLQKEIASSGRIHFGRFMARRIRRLLPAFFLVLVVTLAASVLTMFPQELPRMGKSAMAAALVSSNFHFLNYSGGYFDPSTDLMPLLHTWSLGVEEQYYVIWPLMLFGVWRLATAAGGRQTVIIPGVLLLVAGASFVANLYVIEQRHALVFYMMPFRAWEFALGGLLVAIDPTLRNYPKWVGECLFVLGCVLTLGSIGFLSDASLYPGWLAVLPVTGTLALIAGGSSAQAQWASSCLGWSPMVRVGMLSYAWYLWHWPLLALARAHDLGARSLPRDLTLAFISLVLAWITYRFVETPIRYRRPAGFRSTRGTLISGFAMTLFLVGIATGVVEFGKSRADRLKELIAIDLNPADEARREKCNASQSVDDCSLGQPGAPIGVLAWGDSHIEHWSPLLRAEAESRHERILVRSTYSCPPLLDAVPYKKKQASIACGNTNEQVIDEIKQRARVEQLRGVVISARWNEYLARQETDPGAMTALALAENWRQFLPSGEGSVAAGTPPYDHAGSVKTMERALRRSVGELSRLGLRILIIAPVPELYFNGPQCLYLRSEADCVVPRSKVEERRAAIMNILQSLAKANGNIRVFDPLDQFCDLKTCFTKRDGIIQYTDHNHVSARKSLEIRPAMAPFLNWLYKTD